MTGVLPQQGRTQDGDWVLFKNLMFADCFSSKQFEIHFCVLPRPMRHFKSCFIDRQFLSRYFIKDEIQDIVLQKETLQDIHFLYTNRKERSERGGTTFESRKIIIKRSSLERSFLEVFCLPFKTNLYDFYRREKTNLIKQLEKTHIKYCLFLKRISTFNVF